MVAVVIVVVVVVVVVIVAVALALAVVIVAGPGVAAAVVAMMMLMVKAQDRAVQESMTKFVTVASVGVVIATIVLYYVTSVLVLLTFFL